MSVTRTSRARRLVMAGASLAVAGLLAGCTAGGSESTVTENQNSAEENAESGETVVIGFSGPAADHGWLGAINSAAIAAAESYDDVELRVAEGTNDANLQISQIETFVNDGVDAIVLLPTDGAALTEAATAAMEAGIPVINVDREFSSPAAARATILGDNYGMGVSAGSYICERLADQDDAVVAEIAGIDSLPLTQDRSRGFADALSECGLEVSNRVAADFTIQGGEAVTSQLLSAAPEIDAIWNHDDGCRRDGRNRRRGSRRVLHGRRRGQRQRDARDRGRRHGARGDGHLPLDPGGRRHRAGATHRPGQDHERPVHAGRPLPDRPGRSGRDGRERRRVHRLRVRVLI
jgi:ribose transport system substrate-binding protein